MSWHCLIICFLWVHTPGSESLCPVGSMIWGHHEGTMSRTRAMPGLLLLCSHWAGGEAVGRPNGVENWRWGGGSEVPRTDGQSAVLKEETRGREQGTHSRAAATHTAQPFPYNALTLNVAENFYVLHLIFATIWGVSTGISLIYLFWGW